MLLNTLRQNTRDSGSRDSIIRRNMTRPPHR